jgi:hypothetical protein
VFVKHDNSISLSLYAYRVALQAFPWLVVPVGWLPSILTSLTTKISHINTPSLLEDLHSVSPHPQSHT